MKFPTILPLLSLSCLFVSCGNTSDDANFTAYESVSVNPLDSMAVGGASQPLSEALKLESGFITGDTLEVAAANTPLFEKYPKSGATPSKLLASGTVLQVVSTQGNYIQVAGDGGIAGYVPDVMVVPQGVIDTVPAEVDEVADTVESEDNDEPDTEKELTVSEGVEVSDEGAIERDPE